MKKILSLVAALFCVAAVAQNRPTFILQGGYQGAAMNNPDRKDDSMVHGLRVGAAVDYAFVTSDTYELSAQVGLNYSMKGVKVNNFDLLGLAKADTKFTTHYIDLPILLNSRFYISNETNAFVNFGPYMAYGISGKMTTDTKLLGSKLGEAKLDGNLFKTGALGKGDAALKSFDYGVQVGAGLEYNRIMGGISVQYGLAPVYNVDKDKTRNVSFAVTAGYRF